MTDLLLALDLGTTTLAGRLLSAEGALLAEGRLDNPQATLGRDVISRLEAARTGSAAQLQTLLVQGMRTLAENLLSQAGATPGHLQRIALAANPAITYLLRRLPVDEILFPPHRPRHPQGQFVDGLELGLPWAVPCFIFPLVSGFVGGDLVAVLLSRGSAEPGSLVLDIGTNGEMALLTESGWLATSVAAGPAFEGQEIACGMAAAAGAITQVMVENDSLRYRTIGDGLPKGVCGSGLVEAVATARRHGLIDQQGRIVSPDEVPGNLSRYLTETPDGMALRIYRDARVDLRISQQDVRALQLAKGAIHAGLLCLLQRVGMSAHQVRELLITGSFGFSLRPEALKSIALVPPDMVEKVFFIPAGVLDGVSSFLCASDGAERVAALTRRIKAYPLSGTPAFERAFLKTMDF